MKNRVISIIVMMIVIMFILNPLLSNTAIAQDEIAKECRAKVIEVSIDDEAQPIDDGIVIIEDSEVALAGALEIPVKHNFMWLWCVFSVMILVASWMVYRRAEERKYSIDRVELKKYHIIEEEE